MIYLSKIQYADISFFSKSIKFNRQNYAIHQMKNILLRSKMDNLFHIQGEKKTFPKIFHILNF